MTEGKLFIDGRWVAGKQMIDSINPATEEPIGRVCEASGDEVEQAVQAARQAFPSWKNMSIEQRCEYVRKAADVLVSRYGKQGEMTDLKRLITDEVGKRFPEADIEVIESSDMLRYFADAGSHLLRDEAVELDKNLWPTKKSFIAHEPIGVVAVIKPWNYPLELPLWSIGAALVTGNTVILKPSEHSPFIGLEIARIFEEIHIPKGVINVVTGGPATGRTLVMSDNVDMVAFTGSVETGQEIAIECAKQLRKVSLELGGKDAAIVAEDADIELTANGLVWGAFCNTGQVCVSVERAFVPRTIQDRLISEVVKKTEALRLDIDIGPLISKEQLSKVEEHIADALSKGAKILTGGKRPDSKPKGFYYLPTVLTGVDDSMRMLSEETFGPVLPITLVDDTAQAVSLANGSCYGLGASVWTSNVSRGEEIAQLLDVGMVWINDVNVAFPQCPWGGKKDSGLGVELSKWGIYEYTNKKHINIEVSQSVRRDWWYPY